MNRSILRRRHAIGALAAAAVLAPATEAAASKIVYSCAPELCVVDPATGASARLTSDGERSPYRWPAISRDGRTLVAARGGDVMRGGYGGNLTERWAGWRDMNDVAISPDGSGVAESHSYVENRFGCPLTGGCLQLVDQSAAFFTTGTPPAERSSRHPGGGGVGFLGDGSLLSSRYTIGDELHSICVISAPGTDASSECRTPITSPTTLSSPDGSPDSRLIAVTVGEPAPSEESAVRLYDAAGGGEVRRLASGWAPSFSPDGRQVAFTTPDGWIAVVATRGGRARKLVRGSTPAWGGGAAPGPALAAKKLRYRGGAIPVKVRCGGPGACRGSVRIAKGKRALATASYRVASGRAATVRVRPSAAGRRTIAAARSHRVTVRLAPAGGRAISTAATLRR
ncbi:PD40 domain-containing protein [Conexibacter arvalis]|uniref:WD40 repeat protein n=1 Tax=Conexibacter arvalis TaxID=912552 RepID=A0A840IF77_9ACTN|nr:PD40 domain-containing protein [Conexibacter arvalis]MBB4663466.1 hypothetical protein [Conexibacter arvalis]